MLCKETHGGAHAGMANSFASRVTQTNRDSLIRQVREGILIRRTNKDTMNSKSEWFQIPIYEIRTEVARD